MSTGFARSLRLVQIAAKLPDDELHNQGELRANKLVPLNQAAGSAKAAWYSMKIAPAGSMRRVAFA